MFFAFWGCVKTMFSYSFNIIFWVNIFFLTTYAAFLPRFGEAVLMGLFQASMSPFQASMSLFQASCLCQASHISPSLENEEQQKHD